MADVAMSIGVGPRAPDMSVQGLLGGRQATLPDHGLGSQASSRVNLMGGWARIKDRECPIVIEHRNAPLAESIILPLLAAAPFALRAEGETDSLRAQLTDLPTILIDDIMVLATRFAELTGNPSLRMRFEGVTSNACKKLHADYTDLRLITTYAGPGTDYAPLGDEGCCLERVPTGAVALVKGQLFGKGHVACLHRSPPIEASGAARLVLVIDTPAQAWIPPRC